MRSFEDVRISKICTCKDCKTEEISRALYVYLYVHVYVYIYIHTYDIDMYIYIYIYTCIEHSLKVKVPQKGSSFATPVRHRPIVCVSRSMRTDLAGNMGELNVRGDSGDR